MRRIHKKGFNDKGAIYAISLEQTRGAKKVFLVVAGDGLLGSGVYGFDIDCKTTISEGLIGPRGSNTQNFNACFDTSG